MCAPPEREPLDWGDAMKGRVLAVFVLVSVAGVPSLRADDGSAVSESQADASLASSARPAALTPLMASYVALQALDITSTYSAHETGAWELNPVIRQALGSPAALVAFKAGSAALTIAAVNQLSKRHPKSAILLMIGVNSAYATIVAHNYALRR